MSISNIKPARRGARFGPPSADPAEPVAQPAVQRPSPNLAGPPPRDPVVVETVTVTVAAETKVAEAA